MSLLAIAFVLVSSLLALRLPWVGVLAYYLFSIMQMQYLWPREFGQARVQLILFGATLLGLAVATAMKSVDWRRLLTPFSLLMVLLVIMVNLSMHFSGFTYYVDPIQDLNAPSLLTNIDRLEIFNKTLAFYFIASLLIDTRKKLEWSIYTFAGILLYYTWWANKIYLTGEYWRFGHNGRLSGPLMSNYYDENTLAMLFVMATPVLYYLGIARKTVFFRYGIWFFIPLTWHALFLTSSRGGLLSLGVVCIYVLFRSFDRKASIGLAVGLVLAVAYQSGQLLTRVDDTIDASKQVEQSSEIRLDPRLISWGVATEIMRDYPLLGVGVGNFEKAFPNYSETAVHVAHNTFFQFAANCGIVAGLIYLWQFARRLPTLKRSADIKGTRNFPRGFDRDYLDDLLNSLLLAMFMVAIFLDLMIYEIVYFVFLLSFAKYNLDRENPPEKHRLIDSIYREREKEQRKSTN
ncbi:O-antigen ligase family protein [Granulosicoccus sp.]|nr:O-antigen ligase family protein [Granulosicoccus sp.]MDB4223189.1 O-antigen ligase family protein [Granulosicoccus sp.]